MGPTAQNLAKLHLAELGDGGDGVGVSLISLAPHFLLVKELLAPIVWLSVQEQW